MMGTDLNQRLNDGNLPFVGMTVLATTNRKGGTGKSETADTTEAIATISGRRCKLVDVDDANSGLMRRVGRENVIRVNWDAHPRSAAAWVSAHAIDTDLLIFDLGSGIESADLSIVDFLSCVWGILRNGGARVIILAVIGTNAPIKNFIGRLEHRFGDVAEVALVFNNQDGSATYPEEIKALRNPSCNLEYLQPGLQQVRLLRQQRLSDVLTSPSPGFARAAALMLRRLAAFAKEPFMAGIYGADAERTIRRLAPVGRRPQRYSIGLTSEATDEAIAINERLAAAEQLLLDRSLSDQEQLAALETFRNFDDAWRSLRRRH